MNKIFAGMMFVFLSFEIRLGAPTVHFPGGTFEIIQSPHILGLIPDFIGYALMASGLKELKAFSARFSKIIPLVIIMIIVSIITYVMDLLGFRHEVASFENLMPTDFITIALIVILTAISLFISFNIIWGIKDIESSRMANLNSDKLYLAWKIKAILTMIFLGAIFVPVILVITIIVGFVASVYYLYCFYKSKQLFNELVNEPNEEQSSELNDEWTDGQIDKQNQDQSHEQDQPESETDEKGKTNE